MTMASTIGQPTVAAGVARRMLEFAVSKGANEQALIACSGIDPAQLEDQDNRIPLPQYAALIKAAQRLADDPAITLHYAESVNLLEVSVVGLLGYACENMMEAFLQLKRYSRLIVDVDTGTADRFTLVDEERGLWLIDNRLHPNDFPELSETAFAQMICGTRQFGGKPFVTEVHFTHPDPGYRDECERILGVPVFYNSDRNGGLLDPASPSWRMALQPRYAFGILSEHAEGLLKKLESSKSIRGRVETILMPILHTGTANMHLVAGKMGLSRQTLFRQLRKEGVTFDKLLDDLRHQLALHYMRGKKVSVNEIAYLVGFAGYPAFSRAFKRWTGTSPREARLAMAQALPSGASSSRPGSTRG